MISKKKRVLCFVLIIIAVRASASRHASQTPTATQAIAFVNVNLVPFDRERVVENQTVVVRDGRIAEIGPASQIKAPAGALEIDGRAKYLMPGLADMHVHLYPGIGQENDLASQQLQLFLANGVTTVRNMIGKPEHLALRDRVTKGELLGPTIYTAGPPLLGNTVPTVKVGMRADLLLLDANPLQSVANLSKRVGVMVRGRWLPESDLGKMLENIAALNRAPVGSAGSMPAASTATAATKADFTGTWTLDKNNTEGLPPGMDQVMTVVQIGDKLSLETKLITDQGEQVVPDSYTLDGKETEFSPKAPNGQTGKGVRTARWTDDGNGIEVNEKSVFFGAEGQVDVQMTRKWTLSPDGKTLRIEITVDGPQGKQQVKRTFIRK